VLKLKILRVINDNKFGQIDNIWELRFPVVFKIIRKKCQDMNIYVKKAFDNIDFVFLFYFEN